jgi:Cyclin, N-terminal domain
LNKLCIRQVESEPVAPSVDAIYEFIRTLFNKACLSSECSLVCLIYVERLMEAASVPLLASTWKPVVLCGLLLASKVSALLYTVNVVKRT